MREALPTFLFTRYLVNPLMRPTVRAGLDAMARCYPPHQLGDYAAEDALEHPTHRRCRGGLLSLLRYVAAVAENPLVSGLAVGTWGACAGCRHMGCVCWL